MPEELQRRAAEVARRRGLSLSQLIRQCLVREIALDQPKETKDPFWNATESFRSGRTDLSIRHDDELYGLLGKR